MEVVVVVIVGVVVEDVEFEDPWLKSIICICRLGCRRKHFFEKKIG